MESSRSQLSVQEDDNKENAIGVHRRRKIRAQRASTLANKHRVIDLTLEDDSTSSTKGKGLSDKKSCPSGKKNWVCAKCTLVNNNINLFCLACTNRKPNKPPKKTNNCTQRRGQLRTNKQKIKEKPTENQTKEKAKQATGILGVPIRRQKQLTLLGDTARANNNTTRPSNTSSGNCKFILGPTKQQKQTSLLDAYTFVGRKS